MKKFIRSLTITFFTVAVTCGIIYFSVIHFENKVKEEYALLMQHSQKTLQTILNHKSGDLYMLCILDYHINPNGKEMLKQCNQLDPANRSYHEFNAKLETPYYDFYMKYIQGSR